ncbi:hypothetical protein FHS27_003928 [Rhodopirellula rubra]|uniref:Uncharacterized protein n=1 Tax=Aporhodopirellula rubra TaxID=980271 RepID=A0A7W5H7L9_9BACT|nr:hypothetical protein [Aporhodopirellula rubra]
MRESDADTESRQHLDEPVRRKHTGVSLKPRRHETTTGKKPRIESANARNFLHAFFLPGVSFWGDSLTVGVYRPNQGIASAPMRFRTGSGNGFW